MLVVCVWVGVAGRPRGRTQKKDNRRKRKAPTFHLASAGRPGALSTTRVRATPQPAAQSTLAHPGVCPNRTPCPASHPHRHPSENS